MHHDQEVRYARHISLPEIGKDNQLKLQNSKVLVIGAGGLGSPLLLYLAGAGVGTIGIVDHDRVAISNLQRQIIHETSDIGQPKVQSAAEAISDLNPDINVVTHHCRLEDSNISALIEIYDIVADGCDNFETRFLVNKHCFEQGKTLVSAAVIGFSGQLYTFKPYLGNSHPCYQCLYPKLPGPEAMQRCSQSGVLGSVAGQMGTWQATEVIKELLGIGTSLSGSMIIVDALSASVKKLKISRDPACPCCGEKEYDVVREKKCS
ncbi:MAG: molybdopterin-synthase adenylyltransferase MoeB [bacterium]|nr:molybdopterin-synthase adenylyltransferase MoeB [bacterium]